MKPLEILTTGEIDQIHQASLDILEKTGIELTTPALREMLVETGCSQDGRRILIPPWLVERCLRQCPPRVSIRGRSGKTITLGDGSLHWHNTGGAHSIISQQDRKLRPASVQDVREATRLLDALPGVDEVIPFFTPQDVPPALTNLAMYRHALPFTTKPLAGPGLQNPREVYYLQQMAAVIGPPAEVLSISVSPISPLHFPDELALAIVETAQLGIPLWPLPAPIAGATAPMTLAGALALQNAEVLAAIVLAQLVNPGLPVVYCGRLSLLEPRRGGAAWGVPLLGLASAACVQIGHRYRLPVNVYGLTTDSNQPDIQNGYERALNAILPALAGADELSGIGDLGAGVFSSFAQMVSDNDLVLSIKQLCRGFTVDETSLAVPLVDAVLRSSGNFLAERHTVKALRAGDLFYPPLADRRTYEEWQLGGQSGMNENAWTKAERLLDEHEVQPLPDVQERELDRLMQAAENELCR